MKFTKAQTRFLANLLTNLAAGWIGVILISPNFTNLYEINNIVVLIFDVFSVIFCSVLAVDLEKRLV